MLTFLDRSSSELYQWPTIDFLELVLVEQQSRRAVNVGRVGERVWI